MLEKYPLIKNNLPKLPGYVHNLKQLPNFRKSHAFDVYDGLNVYKKEAPGIGGESLDGQEEARIKHSVLIYRDGEKQVPAWVAFDRKVLRFYAYFQEAVHERREEQYRIRRASIYFYLEDDTIHVSEPRIENSGIPQGVLIRRHRIQVPDSQNGQHYIASDLNVDREITFYGRTFKIIGCDLFTRNLLEGIGVYVPPSQDFPVDSYTLTRAELKSRMKARRPYQPERHLRQFLENDRKVLRFYCVWDDSNNMYGDVRKMEIHYYLSDDTIEIREKVGNHSEVFLRRCKLPKRSNIPSTSTQAPKPEYYTDRDFILGTVIHLYNRPFIICDCDPFTKYYYSEKYGLQYFDPINFEDLLDDGEHHEVEDKGPAIEKSLVGVIGQGVIPPKVHLREALVFDGIVLRFSAKLIGSQYDMERNFVVSLFLADNSISVFEKIKAGGALGGKFLEKGKIRKYPTLEYYSSHDFHVGATLEFYGHKFAIVDADEYAKNFMKNNPHLF